MIYIGYNKKSASTARRLADVLSARRINRRGFKFKPSLFIRWGNSYKEIRKDCIELNSIESVRNTANKLRMARILSNDPSLRFPPCWFFDKDHNGRLIAAYGTAGDFNDYEEAKQDGLYYRNSVNIVRKRRNFINGDLYATFPIKTSREFRVHVFNEKVMGVYEKMPNNIGEIPIYWKDNTCSFKRLDMSSKEVKTSIKGVRPAAVAATKALGLLFGGVDVIISTNGEIFVNEVNSAPGLNSENVLRFTEKIKEYVKN